MQFLNRRAIVAYVFIIFLVALMTGCGGKGQSSADRKAAVTVTQVDISPNPSISLTPGQVVAVFAQALNSNGTQVFTQPITFNSSAQNDPNPIQISNQVNNSAQLCAGKWDSLSNPVVCTPTSLVPSTSNITASAGGVTSPTTVASIHAAIASIAITPLTPAPACVSEAGTQKYQAVAKDASNNPVPGVGSFTWQSSQSGVATIPASGDTGFTDQATATAVHPGVSNITAQIGSVNPVISTPVVFKQCLVNSIVVGLTTPLGTNETDAPAPAHFQIATGATRTLTVVVKDTTGATLTTLPTLSWNTTQPSIATVAGTSTGATVSGVATGTVGISASCLPNNCNIGTNVNVTSNLVSGTITGTPSTSATAYVTCSTTTPAPNACNTAAAGAAPQVKLFPISGTTLGTAITLPHLPNSMMINPQNSRLYIGSTPNSSDPGAGLMIVDAGANSLSSTVTNAPGTVLAVAPNGNAVVTSNGADTFIYNGSTVSTLMIGLGTHLTGATAAAFSPDSGKLIVATNTGDVWFEIPGATPTMQSPGGSLVGAAFFPSGSLQAASAFGTTHVYGIDAANTLVNSPTCGGLIQPLPNADALYAADPGAGSVCVIDTTPTGTPFSIGAFSATQVAFSPDGTHAYLIGGGPVIDNTVGSATKTSITLSAASTTGGTATNGTLYVGSTDNTVHAITFPGGVATDTPVAATIPADLVVAKH